jgi:hypothetical protein
MQRRSEPFHLSMIWKPRRSSLASLRTGFPEQVQTLIRSLYRAYCARPYCDDMPAASRDDLGH